MNHDSQNLIIDSALVHTAHSIQPQSPFLLILLRLKKKLPLFPMRRSPFQSPSPLPSPSSHLSKLIACVQENYEEHKIDRKGVARRV